MKVKVLMRENGRTRSCRAWQGSLWCEGWKFHRHLLEDLIYLWLLWGEGYLKVFNMPGRMDFCLLFYFLGTQGSVFVIFHLLFYFHRNYSCCTRLQKLFFVFFFFFCLLFLRQIVSLPCALFYWNINFLIYFC